MDQEVSHHSLRSAHHAGLFKHVPGEHGSRSIRVTARLFHEPAHGRSRDAVLLRYLRERHAGAAISNHLLPVHIQPRTSDLTTLQSGTAHARPNSFDDDAPLKSAIALTMTRIALPSGPSVSIASR